MFSYIYVYIFLIFKVFLRSCYTSLVRGNSYYYYVLYKRCMLPFWSRTHTQTHTHTHTHTHSPGFPKAFKLHLYTVDSISSTLCGADVVRPFHGCTGREKNAEFWLQVSATEGQQSDSLTVRKYNLIAESGLLRSGLFQTWIQRKCP